MSFKDSFERLGVQMSRLANHPSVLLNMLLYVAERSENVKRRKRTRTARKRNLCSKTVLIPNPKHDKVPTHSSRLELERKGLVIREFPFDREWDGSTLKKKIEEQFPQLEWRLFEYMKVRMKYIVEQSKSNQKPLRSLSILVPVRVNTKKNIINIT